MKLLLLPLLLATLPPFPPATQHNDSHPIYSPDDRLIAFESDRAGHLQVMTIRPDGTGERVVADTERGAGFPRWLPDGKRLVFHALIGGEEWQIFTVNADGSGLRRLTQGFRYVFEPVPSPDGQRLVMIGKRDGDPEGPTHLYVTNADGSAPRRITSDPGRKYHPTWSADGKHIAFGAASVEGNWEIHAVSADGGPIQRVTRDIQSDVSQPSFSRDGKQLAYVCSDDDGQSICIFDTTTATSRELEAARRFSPWRPSWSSDGKSITFDSDRQGTLDLYTVEVESGRVMHLTPKEPSAVAAALRSGEVEPVLERYTQSKAATPSARLVHRRELEKLARDAAATDLPRALKIARFTVQEFPSSDSYDLLGDLLRKDGAWAPPRMHHFFTVLRRDGAAPAVEMYREARALRPGWQLFDAMSIRRLGFHYLDIGDLPRALEIFRLHADAYPTDAWAYEGLGRTLQRMGRLEAAIRAYERLVELDPSDDDGVAKLRRLREQQLAKTK